MLKAIISSRIRRLVSLPNSNEKGQSIVIIAFAILGLIAMLGLALDLGLVYIERTRLKRAVDAATLGGVVELPAEEQTFIRAINYLDQNGYRLRDGAGLPQVNVYIRGCAHSSYLNTAAAGFRNYHDGTFSAGNPLWTPQWTFERRTAPGDINAVPADQRYYLYFPTNGQRVASPTAEFYLDTRTFQAKQDEDSNPPVYEADSNLCNLATNILGTATKVRVQGIVPVQMNFMQFFGFRNVPVWDEAVAQNVTNLDVAIVFDMSGSMQFDTIGYGFYDPFEGKSSWPVATYGSDYPNPSFLHPIPVKHLPTTNLGPGGAASLSYGLAAGNTSLPSPMPQNTNQLCWQRDGNTAGYYTVGGTDPKRYVVIEGELYSFNSSILAGPFRQPGRGFWAVQHPADTNSRSVPYMMRNYGFGTDTTGGYNSGATPILKNTAGYRGSWVSHQPFPAWAIDPTATSDGIPFGRNYTLAEVRSAPTDVPSLEYDFVTANDWDTQASGGSNDNTRIWARIQRGGDWFDGGTSEHIFWAVYDYTDLWTANGGNPVPATELGSGQIEPVGTTTGTKGANYGGAGSSAWRWIELTNSSTKLDLANGRRYTLKIWAGGVGFDIDQIVIGNQNNTAFAGTSTDYNNGVANREATRGSAFRQACNRCNPMYGLLINNPDDCTVLDNGANRVSAAGTDLADPTTNPLFSGYQPIRGAKEAVKRFIERLNPQFDQVGITAYSSTAPNDARVELRCKKYLSADQCFRSTGAISYTEVLNKLEILPPWGSTNMAEGMLRGLEMLGLNVDNKASFDNACSSASPLSSHCGRGGSARRIMIVMTDGVANKNPRNSGASSVNCYAVDLYQPNLGDDSRGANSEDRAKDCSMYYAKKGGEANVTIYTIGLGNGVDEQFLDAIAKVDGSDGQYFPAASPAQLDGIFDAILKSVSVRLIQ